MKLLRRFLAPLLALCFALTSAPVGALPPARTAAILSGVQGWSFPGSSADLYFARNGGSCTINRLLKPCASLLTTTRASTGYAQWADGHLSLFAANIPRITDLGLLVEQAATNLALQSQALATSPWGKSAGVTVTNNAAIAPDGTTTATAVSLNASASANVNQAQTLTAVSYTVSAYVQAQSGTQKFRLNYFDGTTSHASSDLTATTTWQRFTFTFTGVAASGNIGLATDVAAEAANLNVWGFQLELGSFPTSYIPTTTVSVTRAADAVTFNNLSLPAPYSFFISVGSSAKIDSDLLLGGTNTNASGLYGSGGSALAFVMENSVTTANVASSGTFAANTAFKLAGRFSVNDVNASLNGGIGTHDTSTTPPTLTALGFGRAAVSGGFGSSVGSVYFKRTTLFRSGLTDAQLQAISQ